MEFGVEQGEADGSKTTPAAYMCHSLTSIFNAYLECCCIKLVAVV